MLIHRILPASRANGPGLRSVVFVQGCSLGCDGCFNTWSHAFAGDCWPVDRVVSSLVECHREYRTGGVTFSGGEPMQQARELAAVTERLRAGSPGLSIGMFSGYTQRELDAGEYEVHSGANREAARRLWNRIRAHLDFAVMGRYNRLQPCTDGLCSSRNQRLEIFSSRYSVADFEEQTVELTISATGLTTITGFPTLGIPA